MKVMSFNLRCPVTSDGIHYWPHRMTHVIQLINTHSPDILGVQEQADQMLYDMCPLDFTYIAIGDGRDTNRRGERCTLYIKRSKFDILNYDTVWLSPAPALPGSMNPEEGFPRIVTWALLRDTTSGQIIRVYNTHFAYRSRTAQLENTAALQALYQEHQRSDRHPSVMMGDYNATPDCDIHLSFKQDGWHDSRIGFKDESTLTFHAFTGLPGHTLIDYIYVKDMSVAHYEVIQTSFDGLWPSDHFPIVSEVTYE